MLLLVDSVPGVDFHVYPVIHDEFLIFDMETYKHDSNYTWNMVRNILPFNLLFNAPRELQNMMVMDVINGMTNEFTKNGG